MYLSNGKTFASSKTLWVLFIPLITVSNVSVFQQIVNERDDDFEDHIKARLSPRAQAMLEDGM